MSQTRTRSARPGSRKTRAASVSARSTERLQADRGQHQRQDVALAAMLAVQCLALFVTMPLSAIGGPAFFQITRLLFLVYVGLVVLVAQSRLMMLVTAVASGANLAGGLLSLLVASRPTDVATDAINMTAYLVLGYVVARAVFAPGAITTQRLLGAVVLYLNLGLFFGTAYRLILDVAAGAFTGLPDSGEGTHWVATITYFSLVTLTTTGYGDIAPLNPFARSLANLEAVIGQLYPATLLARLIALHVEEGRR